MRIRSATPADGPALVALYNPYILDTAITFEVDPITPAEMSRRIEAALPTMPYLVAEDDGVLGYAYGAPHRKRAAYAWSVETSIWVAPGAHRRGVGRALMTQLLSDLSARGFVNAFAGIGLPNPGSIGLHLSLGFTPVGIYRNVGFKNGAWHDVGWYQLALNPPPKAPRSTQRT